MLFIIELMLLAAGLWAMISGRLPARLLRLLFGKGEYVLRPNRARWYGLLLASPFPVASSVAFLLGALFGEIATRTAIVFEYLYLIAVIIASVVVARRIRRPSEAIAPQPAPSAATAARGPTSYAARLILVFGVAVVSCMALGGLGTLYMAVAATLAGEAPPNLLPFALPVILLAAAVIGGIQLLRLLRR
jgi:hypothetical protein